MTQERSFSQQAADQLAAQTLAQQAAHQASIYNSHLYNINRQQHMWMWNGTAMSIEDFARHAYGDTPEATHFLLRHKDTI